MPHARLLHLCLLNCPALRLEQVTLLLTSLCRCLPRIRRLDLQCVPVIAGPMVSPPLTRTLGRPAELVGLCSPST